MKLLICASHPVEYRHPIIEVVGDMESFSPDLLANYPIVELAGSASASNPYLTGCKYAREHGLAPIELVFSFYGHSRAGDDIWAFHEGELTHRVYRAISPDGKLRMVAFRDKVDVDAVRLGLLKPVHPHYPLEGVRMPRPDVEAAISMIADLWVYDLTLGARAGQFCFPDGIQWGVIVDDREWESSLDWMEDCDVV